MHVIMFALPARVRDVVLGLLGRVAEILGHDRDKPPDGDRPRGSGPPSSRNAPHSG